jgi:hypothetical protein
MIRFATRLVAAAVLLLCCVCTVFAVASLAYECDDDEEYSPPGQGLGTPVGDIVCIIHRDGSGRETEIVTYARVESPDDDVDKSGSVTDYDGAYFTGTATGTTTPVWAVSLNFGMTVSVDRIDSIPYVAKPLFQYAANGLVEARIWDTLGGAIFAEEIDEDTASISDDESSDDTWVYVTLSNNYVGQTVFKLRYRMKSDLVAFTDQTGFELDMFALFDPDSQVEGSITLWDFDQSPPVIVDDVVDLE